MIVLYITFLFLLMLPIFLLFIDVYKRKGLISAIYITIGLFAFFGLSAWLIFKFKMTLVLLAPIIVLLFVIVAKKRNSP